MSRALVLILAVAAFGFGATAVAAPNLPLKNAKVFAKERQQQINQDWDPAGRCRVLTRFSVRCAFDTKDGRIVQTYSKPAAHKLRVATLVDGVGPIMNVIPVPKKSRLYPFV